MKKHFLFLPLGIIIFLNGCNMAPQYSRPDAPIPKDWPDGPANRNRKLTQEAPKAADVMWQDFFTDQKLQKIIEIALNNNRDLRLAGLNVERARAIYGVQRAELFPVVDAAAIGSRQRTAADLTAPGVSRTNHYYSVDLGITAWEIDFFGRINNLKKQALQEYLASVEARRSAQIALISETARVYLTLAADKENLKLAQSTLQTQQDMYNLINRQYEAKISNELDLRRAQTQVDAARVDVARYTQFAAQGQNALNLLAGSIVPDELLPDDLETVSLPKDIAPGLPSEVLLQRPDIMAAEYQLKGAYAFVGAARAAFFPRIALTTAVGTASNELSGLFGSGNGTWLFAPQIVTPIFDARVWAAHRVSKSVQKIALTEYERAIQIAFREVADTLAVRGTVDQQVNAQQSIVNSAQKIYSLSNTRYLNGIDSYLSVLDAQRSLYGAQQGLISLQLTRLANEVRFYAVLGGGGDYLEISPETSVKK
ncbi:MAG: multidrug transporter [Planctomycetes bacterium GWF2_41_51]|nr:MAG: multidrug transporter [Planctomycetes bacterium GWF2_41_51]HBG28163.1 multidrug transporter [Phycisphaerales bacterium]